MNYILKNIMQSYFHQDWREEYSSIDEVACAIVHENPAKYVADLVDELEQLLESSQSDSEVSAILEGLSCEYIPDNARDWIARFLSFLKDREGE